MKRTFAGLTLGALLIAAPVYAQVVDSGSHDTSLPIAITADAMEVEQESQRALFLGAVDVEQGDLRLKADELIVYYRDREAQEENAIYRIEVTGNVTFAAPNETAKGDIGVYDVDVGTITLSGNVVLTSGDNVIRGNEAVMNLETGKSEVRGGTGDDGRVEGLFVPDKTGEEETQ